MTPIEIIETEDTTEIIETADLIGRINDIRRTVKTLIDTHPTQTDRIHRALSGLIDAQILIDEVLTE